MGENAGVRKSNGCVTACGRNGLQLCGLEGLTAYWRPKKLKFNHTNNIRLGNLWQMTMDMIIVSEFWLKSLKTFWQLIDTYYSTDAHNYDQSFRSDNELTLRLLLERTV